MRLSYSLGFGFVVRGELIRDLLLPSGFFFDFFESLVVLPLLSLLCLERVSLLLLDGFLELCILFSHVLDRRERLFHLQIV